ncbi:hypothetical protein Y032_0057g2822 [Ancylostoma ceylanicum]|uniref:Uncharacterized protein n=1 Tax=Ancylostoma ceylanicum TaxID=53326 RepID=A0A016U5T1_9BILA|nr:hypothetical protein Y032_0057g2822 [Ancylostoma ceylanicum]
MPLFQDELTKKKIPEDGSPTKLRISVFGRIHEAFSTADLLQALLARPNRLICQRILSKPGMERYSW